MDLHIEATLYRKFDDEKNDIINGIFFRILYLLSVNHSNSKQHTSIKKYFLPRSSYLIINDITLFIVPTHKQIRNVNIVSTFYEKSCPYLTMCQKF